MSEEAIDLIQLMADKNPESFGTTVSKLLLTLISMMKGRQYLVVLRFNYSNF